MTYSIGIIATAGLLLLAVIAGVIVSQIRQGTLVNNGVIGIRTPQTRASEEAWRVGHRAAVPLLLWVVRTAVAAAVLLLAVTIVLPHLAPASASGVVAVGAQVLFGLVVLLLLAAAWRANGAAREVNQGHERH
ncbi:SdpI family protein [Kineococcus sp. NBC_00420]|uniref:SdpI family protein n=1 Tax=Kineococcus sp. NBC_00420 TaxID=2903564 RepID=UPI002E1CDCE3